MWVGFVFIFDTVYVGFILTQKILGGLLTMFLLSPGLCWLIGIGVEMIEEDGFAGGVINLLLFPVFSSLVSFYC